MTDHTESVREIEDKIEDYLIDCRLNSWEPDSEKIANLVVSIPALMLLRSKTALDVVAEKMEAIARAEAAEAERENLLPGDKVCACLSETGSRQVRIYERCERCRALMESDYPERLDEAFTARAVVANALKHAERERDEWRQAAAAEAQLADDLQAERDRLREALAEMHHLIQTRRTSIHMDGTEMFSQPLLAQLNSIARAALGEDA